MHKNTVCHCLTAVSTLHIRHLSHHFKTSSKRVRVKIWDITYSLAVANIEFMCVNLKILRRKNNDFQMYNRKREFIRKGLYSLN